MNCCILVFDLSEECDFICSDDSHDVKVMPTTTCYDVSLFIFGKKKNSRPCAVDHLFARKWVTGSAVMQQNMAIDSGHTGAETVCRNRCQSPQRFSSAGCDMQNPLRDIRRRNSALMGQRSANCVERCSKADWLFAVG
ncbi:hypothetical protein T01_12323 [Trichinella spiralis]|uniref:Uncharacterized protein n=1 Tax=Trichinella spiralis TaxID=6334 RepID=A0A0V1B2R8_TRISP|nr:hypothetical protein T01_12323 [Trichinella spiralis]